MTLVDCTWPFLQENGMNNHNGTKKMSYEAAAQGSNELSGTWCLVAIGALGLNNKRKHVTTNNRSFASSPAPLYQNEVKGSAFDMEITCK